MVHSEVTDSPCSSVWREKWIQCRSQAELGEGIKAVLVADDDLHFQVLNTFLQDHYPPLSMWGNLIIIPEKLITTSWKSYTFPSFSAHESKIRTLPASFIKDDRKLLPLNIIRKSTKIFFINGFYLNKRTYTSNDLELLGNFENNQQGWFGGPI